MDAKESRGKLIRTSRTLAGFKVFKTAPQLPQLAQRQCITFGIYSSGSAGTALDPGSAPRPGRSDGRLARPARADPGRNLGDGQGQSGRGGQRPRLVPEESQG